MNLKSYSGIVCVCVSVFLLGIATTAAAEDSDRTQKLLFEETFDSGKLDPLWSKHLFPAAHSSTCVKTPARAGEYSHRSILRKGDEPRGLGGKPRAEMCLARQWSNVLDQKGGEISGGDGDERWYGLSIFIPSDWAADPNSGEIILQWLHIWGRGLSPNLDLRILGDSLTINCLWDEGMVGSKQTHKPGQRVIEHDAPRVNEGRKQLASIPLEKLRGRWTDWVFHCKWSSRQDGLTEIWLDGKQIAKRRGPNCRRTDIKFEFKMGIYKPWKWLTDSVTERVIFHDEIRIGGPDATYEDVAPGGRHKSKILGHGDLETKHCKAEARTLSAGDSPLMTYNAGYLPSPDPKAPWFGRSGFIHPVYTPSGRVVTNPFPVDHLHQHGLMFAWTSAVFEGKRVDFWNSKKQQGRVEHVKTLQADADTIKVQLGHVVTRNDKPLTVLNETWSLKRVPHGSMNVFDLVSVQTCATDKPLDIRKYHYGAMCVRGPAAWIKDGEMLTSEAKSQAQGNHTRPNWVAMSGKVDNEWCGIAAMSHPDNFRHPQPVRLHPEKPYFCFAPMVLGDFQIKPGKPYVSRFRFVTFDGKPDPKQLEALWQDYVKSSTPKGPGEAVHAQNRPKTSFPARSSRILCSFPVVVVEQAAKLLNASD